MQKQLFLNASITMALDIIAHSAGTVEYIDSISAEAYFPHCNECPHVTLNNLMVRIQPYSLGECRVPLHCHCIQVHSNSAWLHLIGSYLWVKWKCDI